MAGVSYCLESPSLMKMLDFCLLIPRNEDLELYVSLHTHDIQKRSAVYLLLCCFFQLLVLKSLPLFQATVPCMHLILLSAQQIPVE